MSPRLIATGAFKGPRGPRVTADSLPKGSVRSPGDKGYNGPHGDNSRNVWAWAEQAARRNLRAADEAGFKQSERNVGRLAYGLSGGMAVTGVGGGLALNAIGSHQARKIKAGSRDRQLVKKEWQTTMPFVLRAARKGKVHDVSSMPVRPTREQRFADWAYKEKPARALIYGGGGIGAVGMAIGGTNGEEKVARAERSRRAQLRRRSQRVSKSRGGAAYLRNLQSQAGPHFGSPRKAVATLGRNPQLVAFGAGGGAAAASGPATRRRSERTRDRRDAVARTAYGAVGGQAAYQGATYGSNAIANSRHNEIYEDPQRRRGYKNPKDKKTLEAHKSRYGLKDPKQPSDFKGFYRNFPTDVRGGRHLRLNAQLTTGRRGFALGTAATMGGALLAGGKGGHGRKQSVSKSLYQREESLSPTRAVGFVAGGLLAAYGLGHSRMVGAGIARGVKMAQRGEYDGVADAMRRADAARGSLRAGMAPGEAALRRMKALNDAIERVPKAIRPEVALVAGTMLAGHSTPVRRTSYRPVSYPAY